MQHEQARTPKTSFTLRTDAFTHTQRRRCVAVRRRTARDGNAVVSIDNNGN